MIDYTATRKNVNTLEPGFYDISTAYLSHLQEIDKRVPDSDYHLRKNIIRNRKFYYGPIFDKDDMTYFVPISHQPNPSQRNVRKTFTQNGKTIINLDFRHMVPVPKNSTDQLVRKLTDEQKSRKYVIHMSDYHKNNNEKIPIPIANLEIACKKIHSELENCAKFTFLNTPGGTLNYCDNEPTLINAARKYLDQSRNTRLDNFFYSIATRGLDKNKAEADIKDWYAHKTTEHNNPSPKTFSSKPKTLDFNPKANNTKPPPSSKKDYKQTNLSTLSNNSNKDEESTQYSPI